MTTTPLELLLGLIEIARAERQVIQDAKEALGTEIGRRIDARISFSSIEAVTYALKHYALALEGEIQPEEVLALQDLQVHVDKDGTISTKPGRFGLKAGICLALKTIAAKKNFPQKGIDWGSPGGQAFSRAVKLRDRLTHPKSISDYNVTVGEINDTTAGLKWYGEQVIYALSGETVVPIVPNVYASSDQKDGPNS